MNNFGSEPNQTIDPALAGHLTELTEMAVEIGAEGIFILRGAGSPKLIFNVLHPASGRSPAELARLRETLRDLAINATITVSSSLELADAGVLLVIRFPASDGGEPGIESR